VNQILVLADVYDRLQRAMASDPGGFCDLYRDYLTDARQTLSFLYLACDKLDGEQFRFKAHYLKSSSLILGIAPVAKICSELQDAGRAPDFTAERRKLQELDTLLTLVQDELEKKLGPRVVPALA
jgi:HPt (histidine-containing phosphotransfer) domain-containing protein